MARMIGRRSVSGWGLGAACAIVVGIAGCSTSATGPQPEIEGRWSWVRSEGGLLATERTPATEGFNLALEFDGTGRVRLYQDGVPAGETGYEVGLGSSGGALEGTPVIRYEEPLLGFPEQAFRFSTRHTLVLADGCCDGFTWYFVRESEP